MIFILSDCKVNVCISMVFHVFKIDLSHSVTCLQRTLDDSFPCVFPQLHKLLTDLPDDMLEDSRDSSSPELEYSTCSNKNTTNRYMNTVRIGEMSKRPKHCLRWIISSRSLYSAHSQRGLSSGPTIQNQTLTNRYCFDLLWLIMLIHLNHKIFSFIVIVSLKHYESNYNQGHDEIAYEEGNQQMVAPQRHPVPHNWSQEPEDSNFTRGDYTYTSLDNNDLSEYEPKPYSESNGNHLEYNGEGQRTLQNHKDHNPRNQFEVSKSFYSEGKRMQETDRKSIKAFSCKSYIKYNCITLESTYFMSLVFSKSVSTYKTFKNLMMFICLSTIQWFKLTAVSNLSVVFTNLKVWNCGPRCESVQGQLQSSPCPPAKDIQLSGPSSRRSLWSSAKRISGLHTTWVKQWWQNPAV